MQDAEDAILNFDEDGDGLLSKTEFAKHPVVSHVHTKVLERAFSRSDRDGDGSLAKNEMFALLDPTSEGWCRLMAARMIKRCDLDKDSNLDKTEFERCPAYDGEESPEENAEVEAWPLFPEQYFHAVW